MGGPGAPGGGGGVEPLSRTHGLCSVTGLGPRNSWGGALAPPYLLDSDETTRPGPIPCPGPRRPQLLVRQACRLRVACPGPGDPGTARPSDVVGGMVIDPLRPAAGAAVAAVSKYTLG
jgi:hypothetical protein